MMPHKDSSWYDEVHRGTMHSDPFSKLRGFAFKIVYEKKAYKNTIFFLFLDTNKNTIFVGKKL
jgi:hypothetical protein